MLGSTNKEVKATEMTQEEAVALDVKKKTHTIIGMHQELQIQKGQIVKLRTELNHVVQLYQTLTNQFTQFQQQRAIELNMRVNNGPTSRED